MLYRKVPGNDDELSVLGFGCMRLPSRRGRIDEPRATRMLRCAIDAGVNYVDTARPYHGGQSEPFLGRALADGYRERVKLATKLPTWLVETRKDMDLLLATQLGHLRTERIDYYLLHALSGPSWERMRSLGVLDFLARARADGRIVNAGFSFHGAGEDFRRIVDAHAWDFCMIQYNYLDVEAQAGRAGLEHAASEGLAVMVMEPLRGGLLASAPPGVAEVWEAAPVRRSPVEWALRWVWDHPEVTLLLSGMSEEAHVEENLRVAAEALPGSLTAAERRSVEEAAAAYRARMRAGCTGCGYCMPCPAGVDIPGCLDLLDQMALEGRTRGRLSPYLVRAGGVLSGRPGYASQCEDCGACVDACPQGLAVPEFLRETAAAYEGWPLRAARWGQDLYLRYLRWRELRRSRGAPGQE